MPCLGPRKTVRMARAGAPFELTARQLGHRDVAMVAKVFGRFKPDTEKRDRWERVAAARDAEKWQGRVATDVAVPLQSQRKHMEKAPQPLGRTRLRKIAVTGLEPATPAL